MFLILCYLGTVLIWGSTWYIIKFQLGVVPVELSSSYRFILASIILFIWCRCRGLSVQFNRQMHMSLMAMGVLMCSLNYILFYEATFYVISAFNAILSTFQIFWNILNARLFLKIPINKMAVLGAIVGVSGLVMIFLPEFQKVQMEMNLLIGIGLGFVATYSASVGSIISSRNSTKGVGITEANAWCMLYGGLSSMIIALLTGKTLTFDFSMPYIVSLLYLTIFGSILAFGCYLTLIKRIGPAKGAYALIVTPLISLVISQYFENFSWTLLSLLGTALLLLGNLIVLKGRKP